MLGCFIGVWALMSSSAYTSLPRLRPEDFDMCKRYCVSTMQDVCAVNVLYFYQKFSATPIPSTLTRQIQESQTPSDVQTNKSLEFSTGGRPGEFKLHYDKLVIAVGAYSQSASETFIICVFLSFTMSCFGVLLQHLVSRE